MTVQWNEVNGRSNSLPPELLDEGGAIDSEPTQAESNHIQVPGMPDVTAAL